jgi:hypothetical protein
MLEVGRSFKIDHPKEFKQVQYIWKFRGRIAHGDEPIINHDVQNISLKTINKLKLFEAAKLANNYLKNLKGNLI